MYGNSVRIPSSYFLRLKFYSKKSRHTEKVILVEIDKENEMARVKNLRTGTLQTKTLHWCRKNLIKE